MRKLVFVHGRAQEFKDAEELKTEWITALHAGLASIGADLLIADDWIRFPYYGQTLYDLTHDPAARAAKVVVKGYSGEPDQAEKEFLRQFVVEAVKELKLTPEQISAEAEDPTVIARDVQNWPWVLAALRALEKVPGTGGLSLSVVTHDVYVYLRNAGIRDAIDTGVRGALSSENEMVIVAHSLGTVVTYNLLRREAAAQGWRVPTLITVGSPLGVGPVVSSLRPIRYPDGVGAWFNAFDPRDVVALHPLDVDHFPVTPMIENYPGVQNPTPNRHGISGYLTDPTVARRIRDALVS
jgi:hypothetical protein